MEYQVARLLYQYRKVQALRKGVTWPFEDGNVEFELYGFFEVCHHLLDWLEADDRHRWPDARDHVRNSLPLQLCADLCNTAKHRELTRKPWSGHKPGPFVLAVETTIGPAGASMRLRAASVEVNGVLVDCFVLVDGCLEAWEAYFREKGTDTELGRYLRGAGR